jgi:hypothetical protein
MQSRRDSHPKIVINKGDVRLVGWLMLVAAPLVLLLVIFKVASGDIYASIMISVVLLLFVVGIWMAGYTNTIIFDADSMTVTRGYVPPFMWWLRTTKLSRENARTVEVTEHPQIEGRLEYWVELITEPGKRFVVFKWFDPGEADYVLRRIQRWSDPER